MNNSSNVMNRWFVVGGALLIALMGGLIYTWSLWVKPICAEYGWQTDAVALMGNVMLAAFITGVTLGGQLLPKMGSRNACLIGSLMFGVFIAISSFVTSPILMLITYGVIAGVGVGILYCVGQFTLSAWFPDKRGMVMGLFLAVFGLSVTVFASPLTSLLSGVGVKTTMLLMGGSITVICGLSSLFVMRMPPEGWVPEGFTVSNNKVTGNTDRSLTVKEAVKTKEFWMIFIAYALLAWPFLFISSYFTVFITDQKMLPMAIAVTAVSFSGIGSASGRFIGGIMADKLGCKLTYLIMCLCSFAACIGLILVSDGTAIIGMILLLAIGYGGRTPVYGVIFTQEFGPKYSSAIYGLGSIGTAFICIAAPLATAAIRQANGGSFQMAFVIAAIITVVGCASMMLLPKERPVDKFIDSAEGVSYPVGNAESN